MPRPEIDITKYHQTMNEMLDSGLRIEEITATKVQKVVGGQFSRIRDIVSDFKEQYFEKQGAEKVSPKPNWFIELMNNIDTSIMNQLNDSWLTISDEIANSISLASKTFEEQKAELENKASEDLEQIKTLETENETLLNDSEQLKQQAELLNSRIAQLESDVKNKDESLNELKNDIKEYQSSNLALEKKLSMIEGQLIEKDKIIEKYEKIKK